MQGVDCLYNIYVRLISITLNRKKNPAAVMFAFSTTLSAFPSSAPFTPPRAIDCLLSPLPPTEFLSPLPPLPLPPPPSPPPPYPPPP